MAGNGVNIRLFVHRLGAEPMDIAYIHGKVHAIDDYLPMRWIEYDYEEVPISMDKYSIHGRNILSMDLRYPWVPCNIRMGFPRNRHREVESCVKGRRTIFANTTFSKTTRRIVSSSKRMFLSESIEPLSPQIWRIRLRRHSLPRNTDPAFA